MSVIRIKL